MASRRFSSRTLSKNKRKAGEWYGMIFGIDPARDILLIRRLYGKDGMPWCLEEIYTPDPELAFPKLQLSDPEMLWSLRDMKDLFRVSQTIQVAVPHPDDRRLLRIREEWPVFLITREYRSASGAVEVYQRIMIVGGDNVIPVSYTQGEKEDGRVQR